MSLAAAPRTGTGSAPASGGPQPRPTRDSLPAWGYTCPAAPLGRREELTLIRRAQGGDAAARETLLLAHVRLVQAIARRYRCRSLSTADLIQEGLVGLLSAIARFDPTRGLRLSTYGLPWIRQAVGRAVDQHDRLIHLPLQVSCTLRQVRRLAARQQAAGQPVDVQELASVAGLSGDCVQHLLAVSLDALSLDAAASDDSSSSLLGRASDPQAVDPESHALRNIQHDELVRLLDTLRSRERWVVAARFGLDGQGPRTLEELSRQLRISRERVRQIETQAISRLRRALLEA